MVRIENKKDCCGCGACAQACPKACITMCPDGEGFLYPNVNTNQCVQCGYCGKVCPILNKAKDRGTAATTAYAAYARDEGIRRASSSGGIFTLLAERILDDGGVVFGAAFAEDFSVRHVMIERKEDLHLFRGSKYTQSDIGDAYCQAKRELESDKTVLFSGVACQIAGLKAFLGKKYEKLFTVDVLCHGVPSPMVWQMYLTEQEKRYGAKVKSASFRSKEQGWKLFSMELTFQNDARYRKTLSEDAFMQCFLKNICLRPSCHSCKFKGMPHPADITLGDAWGIGKVMPAMDDDRGTSVVLVNSEKGQQLWDAIMPRVSVERGELDVLLPPESDSRRSVRAHPKRSRFFAVANKNGSMKQLTRLSRRTMLQRLLSFGKRCVRKLLKILKKCLLAISCQK